MSRRGSTSPAFANASGSGRLAAVLSAGQAATGGPIPLAIFKVPPGLSALEEKDFERIHNAGKLGVHIGKMIADNGSEEDINILASVFPDFNKEPFKKYRDYLRQRVIHLDLTDDDRQLVLGWLQNAATRLHISNDRSSALTPEQLREAERLASKYHDEHPPGAEVSGPLPRQWGGVGGLRFGGA
jgi:hypothetical protein